MRISGGVLIQVYPYTPLSITCSSIHPVTRRRCTLPSSPLLMAKGGETSAHEPLEAVEIVGCNTCVDRKEAPFWFRLAHT